MACIPARAIACTSGSRVSNAELPSRAPCTRRTPRDGPGRRGARPCRHRAAGERVTGEDDSSKPAASTSARDGLARSRRTSPTRARRGGDRDPGGRRRSTGADVRARVRSQHRPSNPPPWTRTIGSWPVALDGLIRKCNRNASQEIRRWVMRDVVVVDAVRTPVGRRNGGLSALHPAALLGRCSATAGRAHRHRSGRRRTGRRRVRQPGRRAELQRHPHRVAAAGLPLDTPATTVDTQCGSSQQATNLAAALVAAGVVDVAIACGVEVMSRVPIGASVAKAFASACRSRRRTASLRDDLAVRGRRAHRRQVRHHPRRHRPFGLQSQERGRQSVDGRPLRHPGRAGRGADLGDDGSRPADHTVTRDEGLARRRSRSSRR